MKKLMIAAAIVCAAAMSQAASVTWSSGGFTEGFAGPDNKTMKNLTTYTAICTFYSDAAGTTLVQTTPVSASTVVKGAMSGAYSTTYGYDADKRQTDFEFANNGTYYAQIVITGKDANNKEWERKTDIAQFTIGPQGDATINFYTGAGLATSGNHWGEWSSVPEPTSGMLLLLGVAGLALRRRRA